MTERIDMEIIVGQATVALTLTGIEIRCAEEITAAVVRNLLNKRQRDRRMMEAQAAVGTFVGGEEVAQ